MAVPLALAAAAAAQPVCLVSAGSTLYRVGSGATEMFPGQPGEIVGLTVVPADVSVAGCGPGDVIAIENLAGGRIWRVDKARAGTPRPVEIGRLPAGVGPGDLAFARGRMFGINWGAEFFEFSPQTFAQLGPTLGLQPTTAGIGGLTFDGVGTWYVTNGNTDRLVRIGDPPSQASWAAVGGVGLDFDKSDLEHFGGQVWGALRSPPTPDGRLLIGTFSVQTGVFATVWDAGAVPQSLPIGLATLTGECYPNCDGSTVSPVLNVSDFTCFLNKFAAGDPYANCDNSTVPPILNVSDFICFQMAYAAGCL